jgi:hypothetical protein
MMGGPIVHPSNLPPIAGCILLLLSRVHKFVKREKNNFLMRGVVDYVLALLTSHRLIDLHFIFFAEK